MDTQQSAVRITVHSSGGHDGGYLDAALESAVKRVVAQALGQPWERAVLHDVAVVKPRTIELRGTIRSLVEEEGHPFCVRLEASSDIPF